MGEVTPARSKKRCSRCKRHKDVSQFGVARHAPDGLNYWCRPCKKAGWKRECARKEKLRRFGEQLLLDLPLKRCGACAKFKGLDDFGVDSARRDGRMLYCRDCVKAKGADAYVRRRESIKTANRRWRQANKKRLCELQKKYYQADREKYLARAKQWRIDNPEASAERNRRSYQRNADKRRARQAKRRALQLATAVVHFSVEELAGRWRYYGDKCWVCRDTATATDHVKPLAKGGAHMLCNLRPICTPCNSAKRDKWPFTIKAAA